MYGSVAPAVASYSVKLKAWRIHDRPLNARKSRKTAETTRAVHRARMFQSSQPGERRDQPRILCG